MLRTLLDRLRKLWAAAKSERTTPRELAWAVAVGVFSGCTPALYFHGWIAVGLATLFRLSRLWAFLGSRVSFFLILPWIVLAEIEVGHRLREGTFMALDRSRILEQAGGLIVDWMIGTIPVGVFLALVFGLLAYAVASVYAKRAQPAKTVA